MFLLAATVFLSALLLFEIPPGLAPWTDDFNNLIRVRKGSPAGSMR